MLGLKAVSLDSLPPFSRVSYDLDAGQIHGIAFGDRARPPEIVFLHATGFNALTYRTLLAPLALRFSVLAIDLRGHGRTTLPPRLFGYGSWNRHRDDVIALLERHIQVPVTLAGHSMGATTALLVAARRPRLVQGLALLDPVILAGGVAVFAEVPGAPMLLERTFPIAAKARRRRSHFPDREAARAALTGRGIFKTFPAEVLEDYLTDGLVDEPGGGMRLACSPQFEARTFAAQRHDAVRALMRVGGPVVVLRAQNGSTTSAALAERLRDERPDLMFGVVEGGSHAFPMEQPKRARAAIETAAVRAHGPVYRDLV